MHNRLSKISISVPNDFHYSLKKRALDENITIKQLVIKAIEQYSLSNAYIDCRIKEGTIGI